VTVYIIGMCKYVVVIECHPNPHFQFFFFKPLAKIDFSIWMLFLLPFSMCYFKMCVGRDFVVGTVPRYGLESPGIEFRWRVMSSSPPVQTGTGVHPASCLFSSDKAAGA